jgi:hypothetical protein
MKYKCTQCLPNTSSSFTRAEDVETAVADALAIEPERARFLVGKLLGGKDVPVYSWWRVSSSLIAWPVDVGHVEDMRGLAYCVT